MRRALIVVLILILMPAIAPAEPPKTCLDAIRSTVPPDGKIELTTRGGESLEATLSRVDPSGARLVLRIYDPSVSRFLDREVRATQIDKVVYLEDKRDMQIPIILGVTLGALGLIASQGLAGDPDFGSEKDRGQIQILGPVLGFAVGFFPAYLLLPDKTVQHTVSCGGWFPG